MNIATFHARLKDKLKFSDLVSKLAEVSGYEPLFGAACQRLVERLEPFGINEPPLGLSGLQVEVLIAPDTGSCIVVKTSPGLLTGLPEVYADLMSLSTAEVADIPRIVSEAFGLTAEPGSVRSAQEERRLSQVLGELSPNGKMLADPTVRAAARRLYDDELRSDLSAITSAVGDSPVPADILGQMETFRRRRQRLKDIVSDQSLAQKHFLVFCKSCGLPHLAFDTPERAAAVIADVNGKCGTCQKKELFVEESYAIAQAIVRAIQQGLWLESLVSDVMCERARVVWSGQMVGTNEIDVLSVCAEKVVLIECKDAPLGQNDVYVTAMKAEDVGADAVIMVTTNEVHPNVRDAVKRLGAGARSARTFTLISQDCCEAIRRDLSIELDRMQNAHVKGWVTELAPTAGRRFFLTR